MYPALTTFVTLLISKNPFWIDKSSEQCLQQIVDEFFSRDSCLLMGDAFPELFSKPVYISSTPPEYEYFDVVLVYKRLSDWPGEKLRGRVILLTQSLEMIDVLWTKFRILHLVVILQKSSECEVYTWYPYKPEYCTGTPVLELIDTWRDNHFGNNSDFKLNHVPKDFANCPMKCAVAICPPFVGRNLQGPETDVLEHLLASVKLKPARVRIPDWVRYYSDPKPDGTLVPDSVFDLIMNHDTEIGTTCLVKTLENGEFDSLPSHLTDHTVWHLPGAIPIAIRFGFAQALTADIWAAILGTFLGSLIFLWIVVRSKSCGFVFSWTTARLLSLPHPDLSKRPSIRFFSLVLELSVLVISATYRSQLLLNLFIIPEFRIHSPQEGADHGLTALLRPLDEKYYNQTNHDFWNQIFQPGHYEMSLMFNYQGLIVNKSEMLLGRRIIDRALIFEKFPGIVFDEEIYIYPNVFRTINMVFMLRQNHPLTPLLTVKMLNIIEGGFPVFYIQQSFNKMPHKFPQGNGDGNKALNLKQLGALFFFFYVMLIFCCVVFVLEKLVYLACRPKKSALSVNRRHDQRLRTLGGNREH